MRNAMHTRALIVLASWFFGWGMVPEPAAADGFPDDEVTVTVDEGVVTVLHENAVYNCCLEEALYEVTVGGGIIEVTETEHTIEPCDCICLFALTVKIEGVAPGDYTLVFRWLDDEDWSWHEVELAVVVPDVGQGDEPHVAETLRSDCYEPTAVPEAEEPVMMSWRTIKDLYR